MPHRIISVFQNFFTHHRRLMMPIAIIGGFFVDILTLNRIDQVFDNAILLGHITIVTICIILLFTRETRWGNMLKVKNYEGVLNTLMLFSFGGLFSGFVIFYTRSGSLISGWPFILIMLALMLGTEFSKGYYKRLTFQLVLYFVAVFSYLIFFIPLLVNDLGRIWFLVSGGASLVFISVFLFLLRYLNKLRFVSIAKKLILSIGSVFVVFNILYFTNIIPPVPLSLKFKAVYHSVIKIGEGQYRAIYEENPWYSLRKRSHTLHSSGLDPVYVFTSVYAPVDFTTSINHEWQSFNEETRRWVTSDTISLSVSGGRDGGFRGFSKKTNTFNGSWRVVVRTKQNQVLGYVYFKITNEQPRKYQLVTENL